MEMKPEIIRYYVTPSNTNKRKWAVTAIINVNGQEQVGAIRCHADSKRQALMLKDQFNHELKNKGES